MDEVGAEGGEVVEDGGGGGSGAYEEGAVDPGGGVDHQTLNEVGEAGGLAMAAAVLLTRSVGGSRGRHDREVDLVLFRLLLRLSSIPRVSAFDSIPDLKSDLLNALASSRGEQVDLALKVSPFSSPWFWVFVFFAFLGGFRILSL
ncbi:hypothetical protein NL676_033775 [Syzygium grande]|nr:hypothetical protein NL676_033775 [Syzygium grande]